MSRLELRHRAASLLVHSGSLLSLCQTYSKERMQISNRKSCAPVTLTPHPAHHLGKDSENTPVDGLFWQPQM